MVGKGTICHYRHPAAPPECLIPTEIKVGDIAMCITRVKVEDRFIPVPQISTRYTPGISGGVPARSVASFAVMPPSPEGGGHLTVTLGKSVPSVTYVTSVMSVTLTWFPDDYKRTITCMALKS